jgi:hypothetical protein
MISTLKRKLSRTLMRFRIALYGNNHSWLINHRYKSYHREAARLFKPIPSSAARFDGVSDQIEQFRRDGFLIIPSALDASASSALKSKVDRLFDGDAETFQVSSGLIRLVDGAEQLPEVTRLLHGRVEQIVEGYFRSHFKLYTMSFYRTIPDDSTPASSFLWHFDNTPDEEIKLMIYLDDVREETGAFRFKSLDTSEQARARGFWHRDDYECARDIFEDPSSTVVAEGGPGTIVLFRQGRVVHKATAPTRDHRDAVTMVAIPSVLPWREHYARNKHLLSTNSGLCKNPWTDEPENIGYRY